MIILVCVLYNIKFSHQFFLIIHFQNNEIPRSIHGWVKCHKIFCHHRKSSNKFTIFYIPHKKLFAFIFFSLRNKFSVIFLLLLHLLLVSESLWVETREQKSEKIVFSCDIFTKFFTSIELSFFHLLFKFFFHFLFLVFFSSSFLERGIVCELLSD